MASLIIPKGIEESGFMKNFRRAIRLTFKYRLTILITMVCALALAFSWGANITAILPLVEIAFKGETASQYWNRQIDRKTNLLENYKIKLAEIQGENGDGSQMIHRDPPGEKEVSLPLQNGEGEKRLSARDLSRRIKVNETRLAWFHRVAPWIDRHAPKTPFGTVVALMIFVVSSTLLKDIFSFLHGYFSTRIGLLGIYELREIFFSKAIRLEVNYYNQKGVSDTLSRFTNDMGAVAGGISTFYGQLVREPLKMIVCLIGAALICPRLLLFTFIFIPFFALLAGGMAKQIRRASRKSMKEIVHLYARISETLRSVRIIQVFNRERFEQAKFRRTNRNNFVRVMKIVRYNAMIGPLNDFLWVTILALTILIGSYLVLTERTSLFGITVTTHPLSLGQAALFFAFLIGAANPARRLSDLFVGFQSAASAADRIYEIIDRENTIAEIPHPKRLRQFSKGIRFENVHFSYDLETEKISNNIRRVERDDEPEETADPAPPRDVLHGIHLEIPFGETWAVIGPSGCGKSTLLSLIPRFADPTVGSVTVDDIDLREMKLFDLRKEIGLITQAPILFDGTVEENIRYGTYGKSFDEVMEAARRAYAHDFIREELKEGYQTRIGPHGGLLSGGQMQRLSIARAILKDPRILLLDEATSQIDMQSEALFHAALADFIGNRTTIIVTHRQGALALADQIVIMNDGKIEQIGRHRELLEASPFYAGLFVDRMAEI